MKSYKTCIIGAGVSGIATMKAMKEVGLSFDCYEMSDVVGGNWAFKNSNGKSSAYRSLHIDTSKKKLEFEGFPMPDDFPTFCHHTHMNEYFNMLVDQFDLRSHIAFKTSVDKAEKNEEGKWSIKLSSGEAKVYDYLIVGNGHHWDPSYPEFPGEFHGEIIHSHYYIDPFDPIEMKGKNILVVGIGNSSVDISSELSHKSIAEKLVVSTRRGAHVIPKYFFGKPVDVAFATVPYVPLSWQRKSGAFLLQLLHGKVTDYGLPEPDHKLLEAHPTVSSDFLQRVDNGDITPKPNIKELRGNTVAFVDGTEEAIDVIIYATGYKITFPFFDQGFLSVENNHLPLFKRMLKPGIDNLIFIGFAQAIPSIIELVQTQGKFAANLISGNYELPSKADMEKTIIKDEEKHNGHFVKSGRHTMQVDFVNYNMDLKKETKKGMTRARRS